MKTSKNPMISEPEWQRVLTAYKRGQATEREHGRALKYLGITPLNEDRIRADLKRLARSVATCSDDALRVIEAQTPWALDRHGFNRPALSSGLLAEYIADAQDVMRRPNDGAPAPWRHREAVAVLRELWPGKKARGRDVPHFNEMVQWMGRQLQKLDPALKGEDQIDRAQRAAWNALAFQTR